MKSGETFWKIKAMKDGYTEINYTIQLKYF